MVITPMVHLANDHPITWQPMESMEQQAACWLQHVLHLAIWRRFGDCGLEKNRGRSWKCFTYGATATNRKKCSPGLVPLCWPPSNMTRWLGPCLASHQLHEMSTSCHQMWKAGDFYFFSHDTQLATGWVAWQTPEIWVTVSCYSILWKICVC
jgi:hypothetical protein